jgi:N-acetylneuraminic acid mutarotase
LNFADRVAYQRAIEEVYWRHRIWPEANPGPKPPLDKAMSQAQIEKKVEDYLRNSQALEDYWQRPLTAQQLQAEMDRMAQHTEQPEVLRELFAALGNDPFVIAECLARAVLVGRTITELSACEESFQQTLNPVRMRAERAISMVTNLGNSTYTLPEISTPDGCTGDSWTATTITGAPVARASHTTVWTGTEMIVWGGVTDTGYLNTGGRYNPATDAWTSTSTTNAPTARGGSPGVWTGMEMIVWGGYHNAYLNTGGRYNPSTDSWTATSLSNAPTARGGHAEAWTGTEMIVWGGLSHDVNGFHYFNTGGRYNPSTDSWTATSVNNAPSGRSGHTTVWTASEMIIWGGVDSLNEFNTGGRYNPSTDSWTATSVNNAPSGRIGHTVVWTGNQMIIWGGSGFGVFNTGGTYNPVTDAWTSITTTNAPSARYDHSGVWTGSEMVIWGGTPDGSNYVNTGGRYSLSSNSWTATSVSNAPTARDSHAAAWTGTEMIVWGGADNTNYFNTGGRYCAATPTPPPGTVQVTVQTSPAGLAFNVDGTDYHAAKTFSWELGSSHSIASTTPQSGTPGVRYYFSSWSDGGAISHSVAPTKNTTYTAKFGTQYYLTMKPRTGGSLTPNSSWRTAGTAVLLTASPTKDYSFSYWTGKGNGSYSGTDNPASITMNGPITETATFMTVTVQTSPGGLSFIADGQTYTASKSFNWSAGSTHTIATTTPQSGAPGVRYYFSSWSDGGGISHTVTPTRTTTYTAKFGTQYYLTMNAGTGGSVTPNSGWKTTGSSVTISAKPSTGYSFTNWTGAGTGSFSGTDNPASVIMNSPITETATFSTGPQ